MSLSLTGPAAGQLLYQLGQRYLSAGEWELTAQSYGQLAERFPDHPLADPAMIWLVQYYTSGEVAWQMRRQAQPAARSGEVQIIQASPANAVQTAGLELDTASPIAGDMFSGEVVPAGFMAASSADNLAGKQAGGLAAKTPTTDRANDRAGQALTFAKLIQRGRPGVFAEPTVQFPLSVAFRLRGEHGEAEKYIHRMSSHALDTEWALSAQAELWMANGRGRPPKRVYACHRTTAKPYLDGRLEDEAWKDAEHLELTSSQHDDVAWPAAAMLVYDDEYLYVAVRCRKAPGAEYPTSTESRARDTDLSQRDRVDLCLDMDRDYSTFYQLSVDHRGWTGEQCLGSPQWNPIWYVASAVSEEDWAVETAIPWNELAAEAPRPSDTWAVGLQRIIPGVGLQAYTQPATVEPRGAGFALLRFQ
jgi:hypothetical protein